MSPQAMLEKTGRAQSLSRRRLGSTLFATQRALGMGLLVSAMVLLTVLAHLSATEPGFNPRNVAVVDVALQGAKSDSTAEKTLLAGLCDAVAAIPGVEAVGVVDRLPLRSSSARKYFRTEPSVSLPNPTATVRSIGGQYFRALGMPVLEGRAFDGSDDARGQRVVIVNRYAAQQLWNGASGLGHRLIIEGEPREVVGVVRNVSEVTLDQQNEYQFYVPFGQPLARAGTIATATLIVRTAIDGSNFRRSVSAEIARLDSGLSMSKFVMLDEVVSASFGSQRLRATLVSLAAVIACLLTAAGIYGVTSFATARRAKEFAIRRALGADRRELINLVQRHTLGLVACGVIGGVLVSWGLSHLLTNSLFGVSAMNPLTYVFAAVVLGSISLTASYIPLRGSLSGDPADGLRDL